jgi:hypothetical protein
MAADVTTWAKIVPRRDTADPSVGLAARVADPLWMLARQYQFGEFTGDDGGEPVRVDVDVTWTPLTRWHPGTRPTGPVEGLPLDRGHQPLESLVEDDRHLAKVQVPPVLAAVEAGARLARALRAADVGGVADSLLDQFAVVVDPAVSSDASDLFGGRAIDGFSVRAAIGRDAAVVPDDLDADARSAAGGVIEGWVTWFDQRFGYSQRPTAWLADRLEHRFTVAAPHPDGGELVFHAPEYLGQGIGWTEFDRLPGGDPATLGAAADAGQIVSRRQTFRFPQHIRWPGMPVNRFWEIEDASVDFGIVQLSPTDIAGLLAVDLAVTASTDWYVVELPLPIGGAARIDRVIVTDVFGDRTSIHVGPEVRADLGRLYEQAVLDGGTSEAAWFVLPPSLVRRADGPPLEDVMLVRDEMANLAWAVELVAPLNGGEPVDVMSRLPPPPPTIRSSGTPVDALEYQLTSGVPDNWRPLVAVRDGEGRRVFDLGEVWGSQHPQPFTVLVQQIGTILDEEVPREGKRLQRFWQYGRWADGSRHLWCGREVIAGRGEGNSGLRYDLAIAP